MKERLLALAEEAPTCGSLLGLASPPPGFKHLFVTSPISDFNKAREAILRFTQYPEWTTVFDTTEPALVGKRYVVCIQHLGLYSLNAFIITAMRDEPAHFSLTLRTLAAHAEIGEERFAIDKETMQLTVESYSRPRHWLARLFSPVARFFQRRFLREVGERMRF